MCIRDSSYNDIPSPAHELCKLIRQQQLDKAVDYFESLYLCFCGRVGNSVSRAYSLSRRGKPSKETCLSMQSTRACIQCVYEESVCAHVHFNTCQSGILLHTAWRTIAKFDPGAQSPSSILAHNRQVRSWRTIAKFDPGAQSPSSILVSV